MKKIKDFGKKIGGAKKDMWRHRGLSLTDFAELNLAEKYAYVKRDSIWPTPNARKLIEEGADKFVVFWQRECRKAIRPVPFFEKDKDIEEQFQHYIRVVTEVRDKVMACETEKDIEKVYEWFATKLSNKYAHTFIPEWKGLVSFKIYAQRNEHRVMKRQMEYRNFPYGREKTEDKNKERKSAFIPPQLAHIEREGENYRRGRNVREYSWQKEFNFRGVEFGNWMSQKDRQVSMNYCFDAFKDLAEVLKIADTDIAFNGRLAIAFGARGRSGAVAHYEPLREVINLTKMRGAGSTAHEWMHALDHMIALDCGYNNGGLASEQMQNSHMYPKSFTKLVNALKYDADGNSTDYLKGSTYFGDNFTKEGHGYWTSNCEMLARAFACYVKDTLGKKSDYLVAHADSYVLPFEDQCKTAIPQGEERAYFNELFDELFAELKKDGFFHKRKPKAKKKKSSTVGDLVLPDLETDVDEDGQLIFLFA